MITIEHDPARVGSLLGMIDCRGRPVNEPKFASLLSMVG